MSYPQGYYAPLVYFSDGVKPPQWGAFCLDNIGTEEARVICNQFGYELDNFTGYYEYDHVHASLLHSN